MTDTPRFKPVKSSPDDAWRDYHGAPLVGLVFAIVDLCHKPKVPADRYVVLSPQRGYRTTPVWRLAPVRIAVMAALTVAAVGLIGDRLGFQVGDALSVTPTAWAQHSR